MSSGPSWLGDAGAALRGPRRARRRLLLELDGAIQSVATDHPEHDSIDTLTQVYHNLLRQWSVT